MIYDNLENAHLYGSDNDALSRAFAFLRDFDPATADGKYPIEDDNMLAVVATYETKPADEGKFEAHDKYIDLQLMLQGQEFVDVDVDREHLQIETPYIPERDVAFFKPPSHYASLVFKPGKFAVFFPHDVHRPGRQLDGKTTVRKVVIKIRV